MRLRLAANMSLRDLGLASGMSGTAIWRYERNEIVPRVEVLRKLAPPLGLTPDYLETGRGSVVVEGRFGRRLVNELLEAATVIGIQAEHVRLSLVEIDVANGSC